MHDDHFAQNVSDEEWLADVGRKGWIVLTKDEKIRSRKLELQAVKNHSIGMFLLTAGNMTGEQMADLFAAALPKMLRFIKGNRKPFVATIGTGGRIGKIRI